MDHSIYWIWFSELKELSKSEKLKLLVEYGDPKELYFDAKTHGIQSDLTRAMRIVDLNEKHGIKTLTPDNPLYRGTFPEVIYFQGKPFNGKQTAVVGTRNISVHGECYTNYICDTLMQDNICINSGLAKGIDITAHRAALLFDRPTQAFLAHGLDQCYPREHAYYRDQIKEIGAVFSTFAVGTPPLRHHFLQRNQLMAAFSDNVIVIEAPISSGSIKTAEYAWELGKVVSTIEGTDSPRCAGNNELIKNGAIPIEVPEIYWNGPERIYIETIRNKPMSLRRMESKFERPYGDLEMILLDMECHGWLTHKADGKWHYNGW